MASASSLPPGVSLPNQAAWTAAAMPVETASAVDMALLRRSTPCPEAFPERSSRNTLTSTSVASRPRRAGISAARSIASVSRSTSAISTSRFSMAPMVSKLNRRFKAADISLTPRSRVLAVPITLNPRLAYRVRWVASSSGMDKVRSESTDSIESCTSGAQRVISSKRTTLPSDMPR